LLAHHPYADAASGKVLDLGLTTLGEALVNLADCARTFWCNSHLGSLPFLALSIGGMFDLSFAAIAHLQNDSTSGVTDAHEALQRLANISQSSQSLGFRQKASITWCGAIADARSALPVHVAARRLFLDQSLQ